jgi:beta-glucosidase
MVKNTGKRAGEEVVQLYVRDMVSQPVRPIKELKDFKKIMLQPGEIRRVTFTIKRDQLAFYNDKLERVTQPGTFQIMIGSASDDIRLQKSFELTN